MKKENEKIIQNVRIFLNLDNDERDHNDKIKKEKPDTNIKNDTESEIIKKEVKEWLKLNAERISKELINKEINKD